MPQLQIGDFAPQIVWLAITFIGLYLFLAKVALPKVGSVLDERAARIAADLAEAQRLKTETEQAIAAYEQALAEARAKAKAIIQQNQAELAKTLDAERTKVEQMLAAKTAAAEAEIEKLKASSLGDIERIAAETAEAIVQQILGTPANPSEIKDAIHNISK